MEGGAAPVPPPTAPSGAKREREMNPTTDDMMGDSGSEVDSEDGRIHYYFDEDEGMQYFVNMSKEHREKDPTLYQRLSDRAQNKMEKSFRFLEPDPYFDPDADEADSKWVRQFVTMQRGQRGGRQGDNASEAILSCMGCFNTVCLDCSRLGAPDSNVWMAQSVLECKIIWGRGTPQKPAALTKAQVKKAKKAVKGGKQHKAQKLEQPAQPVFDFRGALKDCRKGTLDDQLAERKSLRWWSDPADECDQPMEEATSSVPQSTPAPAESEGVAAYHVVQCEMCSSELGWYHTGDRLYYLSSVLPSEA